MFRELRGGARILRPHGPAAAPHRQLAHSSGRTGARRVQPLAALEQHVDSAAAVTRRRAEIVEAGLAELREVIGDARGIAAVYNDFVREARARSGCEALVLLHDDVEIVDSNFRAKILAAVRE